MNTNLWGFFAHLFVQGILHFFFILPGLLVAYVVTDLLKIPLGNPFGPGYWFKVLGIAYCWVVLVFFMKGMIRRQGPPGRSFWLIQIIWNFFCFFWPTILFKMFVADFFGIRAGRPISTGHIGCWLFAVLVCWLAISRYGLKKDTAPFMMRWVYRATRR